MNLTPSKGGSRLVWALAAAMLPAPGYVAGQEPFQDRSFGAGIEFVLRNGAAGQKRLIETMTGGVAVFDYDNDGLPDIYFVNGASEAALQKREPQDCNRLYRNKGGWRFADVTVRAGVCGKGYGMGTAAADYDNDGFIDLLVANVKGSTLFHNRGDGTFEDVSDKANIDSNEWIVGAAWLDYDNDGSLDLFQVRYVRWVAAEEQWCGDKARQIRTYCHPKFYLPTPNALYRNNGDGTFTDVSMQSGIAKYLGKGMGTAVADYDHDGSLDIFVANDTVPNFLFHNDGNGRFTDVALEAGVAINDDGKAVSSMGVDFRDIDNDLKEDIFFTALAGETFPFFKNDGGGTFTDRTYATRVGALTRRFSGWGVGIIDFNNDGWKDILTANGDVQDNTEQYSSAESKQQTLMLWNRQGAWAAEEITQPALHRGAAFADLDRDGRVDVVISRLNDTPLLLRNVSDPANNWLALKLVGTQSNRQGIGARVAITAGGSQQVNHATVSFGYASSSEPIVYFGLDRSTAASRVEIEWPSGLRQVLQLVQARQIRVVREE